MPLTLLSIISFLAAAYIIGGFELAVIFAIVNEVATFTLQSSDLRVRVAAFLVALAIFYVRRLINAGGFSEWNY